MPEEEERSRSRRQMNVAWSAVAGNSQDEEDDFHGFFDGGSDIDVSEIESKSESESESDDSECLVEWKNNFSSVKVEAFNA